MPECDYCGFKYGHDKECKMNATAAILAERKQTHGNYDDDARVASKLKDVLNEEIGLRYNRGQPALTMTQRHSLDMICHKIARIIAGVADYKDHWDDIAGYATLIADRCGPPKKPEPVNGADVLARQYAEAQAELYKIERIEGNDDRAEATREIKLGTD